MRLRAPHGLRFLTAALALAICLAAPVATAQRLTPAALVATVAKAEDRTSAGDWSAAAVLWAQLTKANPTNGHFWIRLGGARLKSKDYAGAVPAFEKAIELGAGAPERSMYAIASAYAQLGQTDAALTWLEKAMKAGWSNLTELRTDPALAAVRQDPRFQALTPMRPTGALSPEEGWRSDLRLLSWQMERVGAAPYRRRPKAWFDEQFERLAASAPTRTDTQMDLELARIMRELGDGHSGVMAGFTEDWGLALPVQFAAFDDGVYIVAADPAYRDLLGAQVLAYGDQPIAAVMARVAETVQRDNDGPWVRLQCAYRLRKTALLYAEGVGSDRKAATLRIRDFTGRTRVVTIAADLKHADIWNVTPYPADWIGLSQNLPGTPPLYLRGEGRAYWFEYLPVSRAVYFAFNRILDSKDESLAAFSARLAKFIAENDVDKLIVDLRWNNGGNTNLLPPVLAAIQSSPKVNRGGKLFVLIGGRTFSAGQNAASMLERYTDATFIGEPTGSSPNFVGEEEPFSLPYSKLIVNVSSLSWQGGYPRDKRTWIAPLIYAPVTFADVRENKDPALAAVLSLAPSP